MISFIVPAYNEEQCLAETLDALHATGVALDEAYEIVVADDGSTDQTAAIAGQKGAILVSVANRQIAATRNSGARMATGDWLIFVDADTVVNAEVVQAAVQAMRSGAVGGGAGIRFDEPVPAYARFFLRIIVRIFRVTGLATGCFLFCTRAAFTAVDGFDERYYGAEEIVMSRALKRQGKFVILKQAVTTSARKLRTYSVRETMAFMARMALRGTKALKQRKGMEFWYAERRADPRNDA
ncbi:MAG: glycosyltransferase [Vitreoscilla sp.]|nr:glycosyltransferase [Polaromonas sp.]